MKKIFLLLAFAGIVGATGMSTFAAVSKCHQEVTAEKTGDKEKEKKCCKKDGKVCDKDKKACTDKEAKSCTKACTKEKEGKSCCKKDAVKK